MQTGTGDFDLLTAESRRLADINLSDSNAQQQTGNPWMRFRFAAAHSVVALLAIGQATEPWYLPILFVLVSCWDYCSSVTALPHRTASDAAAIRIAAITIAVIVAATISIVTLFVR